MQHIFPNISSKIHLTISIEIFKNTTHKKDRSKHLGQEIIV